MMPFAVLILLIAASSLVLVSLRLPSQIAFCVRRIEETFMMPLPFAVLILLIAASSLALVEARSRQRTVRVENVDHYLNPSNGFLGTANHFYVPIDLFEGFKWDNKLAQHHFLVKSKYYPEQKKCKITIIDFAKQVTGLMDHIVTKTRLTFDTQTLEVETADNTGREYFRLLKDGEWVMVLDGNYPVEDLDRDDAWENAESCINQKDYSLLFNNCEHFVTGILTNDPKSSQVIRAIKQMAVLSSLSTSSFASSFCSPSTYIEDHILSSEAMKGILNGIINDYRIMSENVPRGLAMLKEGLSRLIEDSKSRDSVQYQLVKDFLGAIAAFRSA